jgi:hypothetical protein
MADHIRLANEILNVIMSKLMWRKLGALPGMSRCKMKFLKVVLLAHKTHLTFKCSYAFASIHMSNSWTGYTSFKIW